MNPPAGVGRAGPAGDEGDARASGHLAVGIGHVRGAALLPADGEVDLGRVVQRVEHGQEAFARHREDPVAALDPKLVDKDASARSGAGACGHGGALAGGRLFDKAGSPHSVRGENQESSDMGAWGTGSFENDTAMDWAASVQSVDDVRKPFERLKRDTDAHGIDPELVVDSDFACELIAAAETVAMMLGRRIPDFPADLAQRLAGAGEPDSLLFHQARNAALYAMRNSELAELWEETAQEADKNEWLAEMTRLIDRLNPEVEFEPWDKDHIEAKVGAPLEAGGGTCAFCNQPIPREQLWGISLYDAHDMNSFGRGFWLHLPCLNARLHHKHAIADLKFDP